MNIPEEITKAKAEAASVATAIKVEEATFGKLWAAYKAQAIAIAVAGIVLGWALCLGFGKLFH
jgi:hypothetical protein